MISDSRDTEAAENARLAVYADRFERDEIEIDPASVSYIKEARGEVYDALWQLFMEDRQETELEGVAVREDVVVAYVTEAGQYLGVIMTLPGVVTAKDYDELDEYVRDLAAEEYGIGSEQVQVTVRFVPPESIEATLIRVMLLL
ncbi:hypothetical protein ACFQS2_06075 [Brachybacterium sp. GCM10030267]|uniref:hypothetical protein n=1 Tax=Brachybacterium sp. GCM10030267 TaxID=3273381 RepID=UPI00361EA1DE